jgi:hypothetical protein
MRYVIHVPGVAEEPASSIRVARQLARAWSATPGYAERVTVERAGTGVIVAGYILGRPLYYPTQPQPATTAGKE